MKMRGLKGNEKLILETNRIPFEKRLGLRREIHELNIRKSLENDDLEI